jgi:BirA family biotin operon repressor/biotin-[acetyl-CoA-carboxylase] ligase
VASWWCEALPELGRPRLHLRSVDSTNDRARALAADGAPHGTTVTAAAQTAGHGRQGRPWSAPPGRGLLCSVLVRRVPRLLPLLAGVAVAETADALRPPGAPTAMLKWPNDVLVKGRKVAGILVEGRPQQGWAVVGVGLNVAIRPEDLPAELRESAGGLGLAPEEVERALAELLGALARWLDAPAQAILEAVRRRDALAGRAVRWGTESAVAAGIESAVAAGIDGEGRLVVWRGEERLTLQAGEVHLLPG